MIRGPLTASGTGSPILIHNTMFDHHIELIQWCAISFFGFICFSADIYADLRRKSANTVQ